MHRPSARLAAALLAASLTLAAPSPGLAIDALRPNYDPHAGAGDPVDALRGGPTYRGLRSPGLKYVESASGARELYDLASDPGELRNLAGRLARRQKAELAARLARLGECRGEECWRLESVPLAGLP